MKDEISIEKITKEVEAAAINHYGKDFVFRPNQKEAVVNTIYNWLSGTTNDVILQGPTGSGKSAIGLLVAAVLSEKYNKKGYIVISDLSLIQQYERDCEKYFKDFAVIKGQQTYTCYKNGMSFAAGYCKLKGCKTYGDIRTKFPECISECQYLIDREAAIRSNVTICTYSFWLIQQNVVKPKVPNAPFESRDFTICDEAHKLVSIVQNHFSPTFSESDLNKFKCVIESASPDDLPIIEKLENLRDTIKFSDDNEKIFDCLEDYVKKMEIVIDAADVVKRNLVDKLDKGERLEKEDNTLNSYSDFINEHLSSFSEYVDIIGKIGVINMVKNPNGESISFNCIDESYLMGKYFHSNCGYKLYMSATIGEPNAYARDSAINGFYSIDIPSTFDFTNSPIFYVNDYKLSYKEKRNSLPKIIELIVATINMYSGKRGIIQTGSYEFSKALFEGVPLNVRKRLISYDGSKEKDEAIDYFKRCDDKILVGPSLIEGLSFDDDLCRFQIIMKVPYPSLADKFVKAKQELKPEWYSNITAISILQGVGRGIRNEHDWCCTFIFDGCFTYLMQRSYGMFPKEFINRIKTITPKQLGC